MSFSLVPMNADDTMSRVNSDLPYMKITCEPILNSTAIAVAWEQTTSEYELEFVITFSKCGYQPDPEKAIRTKHPNATLYGVLPGNKYNVQVMTISTISWRSYETCTVPPKSKYRVY